MYPKAKVIIWLVLLDKLFKTQSLVIYIVIKVITENVVFKLEPVYFSQ